jgi:AcrR family transcriptional regulator
MRRRLSTRGLPKRTPRPRAHDVETRQRLLDAALHLFTEHGFSKTSVRDICHEAGANLAAVNYHFGDKLGLYMDVVRVALDAIREMNDVTMQAREGSTPDDKLRHYVRTYLPRIVKPEGQASWIHKLMGHEMTEPTPAAQFITEQMILPRIRYLAVVVSDLLGCSADDPRVNRSIVSLQAQCLFYAPDAFRDAVFGDWRPRTPTEVDAIATHIAEFSLAGIRAIPLPLIPETAIVKA